MKISVITINYNDKLGLKKTFDSVFNQTFKDFEYLVIDGSSTDGSKELIEENALKINYWISEKDTGVYNAMNKGIKAAKGEYLIFMNSGDCFADENVLEKTKQLINSEAAIYYGDVIFIGQNEQRKYKYDMEISYNFFRNNSFCHQSTFIKKTLFESIFYYNENFKIVSDWEFFAFAVCIKNVVIQHLDFVVSHYDMYGISSTEKFEKLKNEERKIVFERYFTRFENDYKHIDNLNNNRVKNVLYVKQFKIPWSILKFITKFLMLFIPKKPRNF